MNKKILTLTAALLLVFTACANTQPVPEVSAVTGADLAGAITSIRDESENSATPVVTSVTDQGAQLTLATLDFAPELAEYYAVSASFINIRAYAVAVIKPVDGNADAVKSVFETFIKNKQAEFENYLPAQYEIAQNALVETLDDGTMILVMTEDSAQTLENLKAAIAAILEKE